MLRDDRDRIIADERRAAGDHFVEQCAERVEVRARRHLAAQRLLGRHVVDRAEHETFGRHARAVEGEGQPEVAELRRAVGHEPYVARLEVAVDHTAGMGMLECLADLRGDAQRVGECQLRSVRTFSGSGWRCAYRPDAGESIPRLSR